MWSPSNNHLRLILLPARFHSPPSSIENRILSLYDRLQSLSRLSYNFTLKFFPLFFFLLIDNWYYRIIIRMVGSKIQGNEVTRPRYGRNQGDRISLIDLIDRICTRRRLHMLNRPVAVSSWHDRGMSRGSRYYEPLSLPLSLSLSGSLARLFPRAYTHQRTVANVLVRSGSRGEGLVWSHVYAECHLSSWLICHVLRYGDASDAVIIKMRISNNLRRI